MTLSELIIKLTELQRRNFVSMMHVSVVVGQDPFSYRIIGVEVDHTGIVIIGGGKHE